MQGSRIRELRKARGLTLQEVADRVPPHGTTAQTIGRLETGLRKLTIDWVDRLASALNVEPGELLLIPEAGDIPIDGAIGKGGMWSDAGTGTLMQRVAAAEPIAVRISESLGSFAAGDILVCNRLPLEDTAEAAGRIALVRRADGNRQIARVTLGSAPGRYTLVPVGDGGDICYDTGLDWAAPVIRLIREFA